MRCQSSLKLLFFEVVLQPQIRAGVFFAVDATKDGVDEYTIGRGVRGCYNGLYQGLSRRAAIALAFMR